MVCYYKCVDNETGGEKMVKHPCYIILQEICQSDVDCKKKIMKSLNYSEVELLKKINGDDDFSFTEGILIGRLLNMSLDHIFFTKQCVEKDTIIQKRNKQIRKKNN